MKPSGTGGRPNSLKITCTSEVALSMVKSATPDVKRASQTHRAAASVLNPVILPMRSLGHGSDTGAGGWAMALEAAASMRNTARSVAAAVVNNLEAIARYVAGRCVPCCC